MRQGPSQDELGGPGRVGVEASSQSARRLATLVVTAVEGSVAVCRAERSTRALDDVAVELDALLSAVTTARDE